MKMDTDEFDLKVVAGVIGIYLVVNTAQLINYVIHVKHGQDKSRLILPFKVVKCIIALGCIANLWDIAECIKADKGFV